MEYKKLVLVLVLGCCWGANFPISKIALNEMDPYTLRFISCILSLVVYMVVAYPIKDKFVLVSRQQYIKLFLLSIPIVVIVPLFNLLALSYIKSSSAVILVYSMPAFNSLIYIFSEKTLSLAKVVPIILCLLGIFFVLKTDNINLNIGEIIILVGAFIWGLGGYLNDRFKINLDIRVISTIQLVFATLVTLVIMILSPKVWQGNISSLHLNMIEIFSVMYLGVVGNGIAFIIFYKLMTEFGSAYTSYSLMLVPIFGISFSIILNNESIGLSMFFGLLLMCLSMISKNYIFQK